MTAQEKIIYAFALVLLGLPAPLLLYAWFKWYSRWKAGRLDATVATLLAMPTLSYVLLLLGLTVENAIGPHYSTQRMMTIYVNLGIMGAVALCAVFTKSFLRRTLLLNAGVVFLAWAYLAVVSSVV
jgi:hypothetical protein